MANEYVVGIDVGTGSARAGIFDLRGKMAANAVRPIRMWRPQPDFVEQSSEDIWRAVCAATRESLKKAKVASEKVIGIAFDATCSLVAIDAKDQPVSVSPTGLDEQNVIVWMDHRAMKEARELTAGGHEVLRYLGGVVSPEHEIPKLLWLKRNQPGSFRRAARFMDLADWLTYRCTSRDVRSLCTTVCKWTYLAHEQREPWHSGFFAETGLSELLDGGKIGSCVEPMGSLAGELQNAPARQLGLKTGTAVGVGIIDAHAGGLGVIGMQSGTKPKAGSIADSQQRRGSYDDVLALIGGTSSCHMAVSPKPRFVNGVWGPYFSAMLPGYWLNEGGQSATGSLLDFIVQGHPLYQQALKLAKAANQSIYEYLNAQVRDLSKREKPARQAYLTSRLHMLPYFHGNRSPNADPSARGAIHGLKLSGTMDDYARLYYCTIQAVAYGTRDIIASLNVKGYRIGRIHACGGGTKNQLWLQEHADITGCEIVLPKEPEAVLLGTAILAAVATGRFADIRGAMQAMSAAGKKIRPDERTADYHARKFEVFRKMYKDQKRYDLMMSSIS
jgi:FGGY-family pentulose kinase